MTITEFLEARIAEDEAEATERGAEPWYDGGWPKEHVVRLLKDCAAKRAIVTSHGPDESPWDEEYCRTCADWDSSEIGEGPPALAFPCPTFRAVAAVYSDHPDYQQEWAA